MAALKQFQHQHNRSPFQEKIVRSQIKKLLVWLSNILAAVFFITQACAAPGSLANSPLFTSSNGISNIFFELDDSGSMDWEVLVKPYWDACAYDPDNPGSITNTGSNCGSLIDGDGLFRTWSGSKFLDYAYLFENGDNLYDPGCEALFFSKLENCPPAVVAYDWRVRASAMNVLYYDPLVTYMPWQNGDGTMLPNATFNAVRSNPKSSQAGYAMTRDLTGFVFEVWTDSHGFNGSRPTRGININRTSGANGLVDFWDNHVRYTVSASSIEENSITYAPTGTGNLNTNITTNTLSGGNQTPWGRTLAEEQQNIANWYQYYRKRSFVAKAAIAKVISDHPDFRYGLNTINRDTFFTEVPPGISGFIAHNTTLINDLFDLKWDALGTPLRGGLARAGDYFDNTDGKVDPIAVSCQQNYTALITDGYWNDPDAFNAAIGDSDGDGLSGTIADVADYYYKKDLSPLPNAVSTTAFDKATYQHMVTFGVAFGLQGLFTDPDNDGWPGNSPGLATSDQWGNPFNSDPEKIDDLWHAAFNSKGSFTSAKTPQALANALDKELFDINDRAGSAASVSFNSNALTNGSTVFLAQFAHTGDFWSGDLLAFTLNAATGAVSTNSKWTLAGNPVGAAGLLDARPSPASTRTIITHDGNVGIPFQWSNLTNTQKDDLRTEPNGSIGSGAKAQARLDYLRGDRTNEALKKGSYIFKDRKSLLGDIINSDPVFVGKPNSSWPNNAPFPTAPGEKYSDFSATNLSRAETVYVGANDGMLHGFYAANGSEVLGYIPGTLYSSGTAASGLHFLTDIGYSHRYYVDSPLTVEDAYFSKSGSLPAAWHTILVGGERAGGKGIFALDVTNPGAFTEANASQISLWEFDSNDDADMGYSYGKPIIGMLANGRWAAILSNGYNNNGDGKAKLFILYLDGGVDGSWTPGTDYVEISTNSGSIVANDCVNVASDCNGLSAPQVADINSDNVIDRVYAGDLKGNLWVFDLADANASNWTVAYSGNPLFKAGQPITDKPTVITHPNQPIVGNSPNLLVFFGTGQYLVTTDIANTTIQAFYGVWDHGVSSLTTANLVEQTFISGAFTNSNISDPSIYSVLTDNPVDYSVKQGWFIKLTQNLGERVIVDNQVFNKVLFFNTWIPDSSPCGSGGSGVLMSVRPETGGRPISAVFSLTGSSDLTSKELLTQNGTNYTVAGEKFAKGMPSSSGFLPGHQYTAGSDAGARVYERTLLTLPTSNMKRISWQELR